MADVKKYENPSDALTLVIEKGPDVLLANQERLSKVKAAVQDVLADIQRDVMDEEMDQYLNKVQVRMKALLEEMKDERMDLTRGLDMIKSAFTAIESEIDPAKPESMYNKLAAHRVEFAKKQAELRRKQEEANRIKLETEKERNTVSAGLRQQYEEHVLNEIADHKDMLLAIFEHASLDAWDEVEQKVINFPTAMDSLITFSLKHRCIYLSQDDVKAITDDLLPGLKSRLTVQYEAELSKLKRELMDQLPGKKAHLQELHEQQLAQAAAEREAKAAAEAAAQARNEQEKLAAEERSRAAAAEAARQEQERIRLQEEAEARERVKRQEEAEKTRIAQERAKEQAEIGKSLLDANTNFQAELDLMEVSKANAVEEYEIRVKQAPGWLQIISFYFQNKGNKEDAVELEKRTLLQMRKFAEKEYKKTGQKIDSPLLSYEVAYKVHAKK